MQDEGVADFCAFVLEFLQYRLAAIGLFVQDDRVEFQSLEESRKFVLQFAIVAVNDKDIPCEFQIVLFFGNYTDDGLYVHF